MPVRNQLVKKETYAAGWDLKFKSLEQKINARLRISYESHFDLFQAAVVGKK